MGSAGGLGRRRGLVVEDPRLLRVILVLAAPLFLSAGVQSLYEVVDTFWLSRLGRSALAVPSVAWQYRGVMMSVNFGVASSLSALVGQYVGAERFERAERSIGTVLGVLLALNAVGAVLLYLGIPLYLRAVAAPADVVGPAAGYLAPLVLSVPFTAVNMVFNFALSAAGDTRTVMWVSLAMTLVNAGLDPLLIYWAGLGAAGAGAATAAASGVGAAYALYSFATGRHGVRLGLRDLRPDPALLRLAARVSAPVVAQRLGMNLGFIAMARIVDGLGTPVVAAYTIGQVVLSLDRVFALPLIRATGIVVSQSLGAGLRDRALRAARTGLGLILGIGSAYTAWLLLWSTGFIGVFTRDPLVLGAAEGMVRVFGPSVVSFNVFMLANVVGRSSGHTLLPSILGIARLWALRIPLSWLLAYRLGLGDTGLWAGMAASNHAAGAAAAWLLHGGWAEAVIEEARGRPRAAQGAPGA